MLATRWALVVAFPAVEPVANRRNYGGPVEPFLLQLAGWMGCGKSTIASAVARERNVVVLDHDTTKSALLRANVPHPPAGAASYEVLFSVAADLLVQGHSVAIDSPSLYPSIPERGMAIARALGVRYHFIECQCSDELAAERLMNRRGRLSQVTSAIAAEGVRQDAGRAPHRPNRGVLVLDTGRDLDSCVREVLEYLEGPGASDA